MAEELSVDEHEGTHRGSMDGDEGAPLFGVGPDRMHLYGEGALEVFEGFASVGAEVARLGVNKGDLGGSGHVRRTGGLGRCLLAHGASVVSRPWWRSQSPVNS